jgi:hypothetical protein
VASQGHLQEAVSQTGTDNLAGGGWINEAVSLSSADPITALALIGEAVSLSTADELRVGLPEYPAVVLLVRDMGEIAASPDLRDMALFHAELCVVEACPELGNLVGHFEWAEAPISGPPELPTVILFVREMDEVVVRPDLKNMTLFCAGLNNVESCPDMNDLEGFVDEWRMVANV